MNDASDFALRATQISGAWGPSSYEFKNVSLHVKRGERVAILGEKVSSRILLLRILSGLRPSREGNIEILGSEVNKIPIHGDWDQLLKQQVRRKIGVCLENEGLLSNVSVREGLELLFRFKYGDHNEKLRKGAEKAVSEACSAFGILDVISQRPFLLNSAEKRLAGLARSVLSHPQLLVLENPSKGIGDSHRDKLFAGIYSMISDSSRTLILTTDDWILAKEFCNRWIILHEGQIEFDGSPKEFLKTNHSLLKEIGSLQKHKKSLDAFLEEVA